MFFTFTFSSYFFRTSCSCSNNLDIQPRTCQPLYLLFPSTTTEWRPTWSEEFPRKRRENLEPKSNYHGLGTLGKNSACLTIYICSLHYQKHQLGIEIVNHSFLFSQTCHCCDLTCTFAEEKSGSKFGFVILLVTPFALQMGSSQDFHVSLTLCFSSCVWLYILPFIFAWNNMKFFEPCTQFCFAFQLQKDLYTYVLIIEDI